MIDIALSSSTTIGKVIFLFYKTFCKNTSMKSCAKYGVFPLSYNFEFSMAD